MGRRWGWQYDDRQQPQLGPGTLSGLWRSSLASGPGPDLPHSRHQAADDRRSGLRPRPRHGAIARALAIDPTTLLMDEPFGALDEQTRMSLQTELLNIWSERKKTVVFITHSISESIVLADRIVVLGANPGHVKKEFLIEIDRPRDRLSPEFVALEAEIQNSLD